MILKSLHLEYFKQYGHLDLDFREGLVGIVGRNGAGKSSIFEAVLLCLFGKTISDKEFYKTSWAPPKTNTMLELLFELDNKVYKVRREFRGKAMAHQAYLYDPQEELIANGATPVSDSIAALIGLDRDAFMRSVFSGQKELGIISSTRGEERKRMVRRMVGLDKLDKIQQLARDDRNDKKREIQGQEQLLFSEEEKKELQKTIKVLDKSIAKARKEIAKTEEVFQKKNTKYLSAKKEFDQLNISYKSFNELSTELVKWEEGLESLQNREKEVKTEITTLKEAQQELKKLAPSVKQFEALKKQIRQLEKERQQYERLQQIQLQRKALSEQIDKLQSQTKELDGLTQEGKKAAEALEAIKKDLFTTEKTKTELEQTISKFQTEIGAIKGRIKERSEQFQRIESLGKDANCPTCLQPLVDSYDSTLDRLKTEVANYEQKELTNLKQSQKTASDKLIAVKQDLLQAQEKQGQLNTRREVLLEQYKQCKAAKKELDNLLETDQVLSQEQETLKNIQFDPKVLAEVQSQVEALETTVQQFNKLESQLERLSNLQEQLKELGERIVKGKTSIKEKKTAIKALNFSVSAFEKSKSQMDQLETDKDAAQAEVIQHNRLINELQQEHTANQSKLDNQERIAKEINTNRNALNELELLDKLFSRFKNQMLIRIRPTIKDTAGRLFEQITRGRYEGIEVDDNFEFHIFENGQSFPIHRFSGGEIDLANLCLRIGIGKAIAELSGSEVAMNFLAFDEIFGSQDEERRFEILLALDHLKEQYRQIYIISHIDTIKEHFPNILEVRKGADGSFCEWR